MGILLVPTWRVWLQKPLSDIVELMIEKGQLPIEIADAFDDIGQFLQRLSQEIMQARARRGMRLPPGPDD